MKRLLLKHYGLVNVAHAPSSSSYQKSKMLWSGRYIGQHFSNQKSTLKSEFKIKLSDLVQLAYIEHFKELIHAHLRHVK